MKKRLITIFGVALALGASVASADIFSFNLTTGNTALNPPFTGPYETVTVNRTTGTTATITFTSLTQTISGTTYDYLLGGAGAVGVNVNSTNWSLGAITGSNSFAGFTPGPYSNGGAGNEDGFGGFNQTIDSFDGYTHSSTEISFTLTDLAGTWSSASQVLLANAPAAAHVFVCAETAGVCTTGSGAVVTGFAAGVGSGGTFSGEGFVPEPGSIMLLGTALMGLAFAIRRKRAVN